MIKVISTVRNVLEHEPTTIYQVVFLLLVYYHIKVLDDIKIEKQSSISVKDEKQRLIMYQDNE